MSLLQLPIEILFLIFDSINDPLTFRAFSHTHRTLLSISLDSHIQRSAKKRFTKRIEYGTSEVGGYRDVLPSGILHGEQYDVYYKKINKSYYENGKLNGISINQNEQIYEYPYVNGILHGESKKKALDGTLLGIQNFQNSIAHGPYTVWYPNGSLKEESSFKDDKQEGLFKSYHEVGTLLAVTYFSHGLKNGEYKKYYENSNLQEHCYYNNGKKTGNYESYYENGQLEIKCSYINDVLTGEYSFYDKNGVLQMHFFY